MTLVGTPVETLDYVLATAVSSPSAETVMATTDTVQPNVIATPQQPNPTVVRPVTIEVNLNITAGTGATAVVVRCRQVSLTGTVVGNVFTETVAAASSYQFHFKFRDSSGIPFAPGGTVYVITVAETSASGSGTVNAIDVEVKC